MKAEYSKQELPANPVKTQAVSLLANYYAFKFTNPNRKHVFKYTVKFEPEIPDNSNKMRNKVLNKNRDMIKEKYLGFYIFLGSTCIYSLQNCPEIPTLEAELDGVNYKVSIEWVQCISKEDTGDMLNFLKCFFNSMLRRIRFK